MSETGESGGYSFDPKFLEWAEQHPPEGAPSAEAVQRVADEMGVTLGESFSVDLAVAAQAQERQKNDQTKDEA